MEENQLEFIADRKSICYSHVQIKLVHANQDFCFFVIADGEKSLDDDSEMSSMFLSSWLSTQVGMT